MSATRRHRIAAVAGAALAAALAASGPAHAAPAVNGEFSLTGQPQYLAKDAAGNVWTPLAGLAPNSGPRYITKGSGDTLWVGLQTSNKVARITGVEAPPAAPTTPSTTTPPSTTPPTTGLALSIMKFKVVPSSFSRGTRLPALTTGRLGTQLRFTLTKPARVRFTFAKGTVGRRVGRSCVKRTRANTTKKRCVYYTPVRGSFTVNATSAGEQRVRFQGRITAKRSLQPGRYRVTATATDGATSARARATFGVKQPS